MAGASGSRPTGVTILAVVAFIGGIFGVITYGASALVGSSEAMSALVDGNPVKGLLAGIAANIGNPGAFGFRMPESMRRAIVENLHQADPYCHQKGIFPAREAVVMQQQTRGVMDVTADDVFIGNGVSELIMIAMRALLNPGDEVIFFDPYFVMYPNIVSLVGGVPVPIRAGARRILYRGNALRQYRKLWTLTAHRT